MKIPYYPGCTLKTTADYFETSAIASAKALGIEMVELPDWNCCGVVGSLTSDDLIRHLAPVRNMLRVEEMNARGDIENENRLLTLCSMCYNTLQRTNARIKQSSEDLESINNIMYLEEEPYKGTTEVVHFFQLLEEMGFDELAKKIVKPLKGLKIAPYYGCMLLRPEELGIDKPDDPTIMENFVESLGADAVQWNARSICCGSYHTVSNKEIVVKLAYEILHNARKCGADLLITSCPLCAFNLDNRQEEVEAQYLDFEPIPVLYFSQLLALALGLGVEATAFDKNYIDPRPILKKKGLLK